MKEEVTWYGKCILVIFSVGINQTGCVTMQFRKSFKVLLQKKKINNKKNGKWVKETADVGI